MKPTSTFFFRCVLWINFAAPKSPMLAHLYTQTVKQKRRRILLSCPLLYLHNIPIPRKGGRTIARDRLHQQNDNNSCRAGLSRTSCIGTYDTRPIEYPYAWVQLSSSAVLYCSVTVVQHQLLADPLSRVDLSGLKENEGTNLVGWLVLEHPRCLSIFRIPLVKH